MADHRPLRLEALGAAATGAAPAPRRRPMRLDEEERGPFGNPPFVPMSVVTRNGDHVTAAVDGLIGDYAIGHLAPETQALIVPRRAIRASLADAAKRTMLGILSDKAIDDVHDEDPMICPIAVAIIRAKAPNAGATIRQYLAAAPRQGRLNGKEASTTGADIVYAASERRLCVEWREPGWAVEADALRVEVELPATALVAAIGRPLEALASHTMLDGKGAVVVGTRVVDGGTEISFVTPSERARLLPEAGGRKMRF